jgi:TatD DNase family protein
MIIDSHCHLDYPDLFNQLEEVRKRALLNEVKYLLTICTTLESFKKIEHIVKNYDNIFGTFGIHPHETKNHKNVDTKFITELAKKNNKVIGIGETGLDYYYNHSEKKDQKKSFIEHINAALELDIPVIVHSRDAEDDTYKIIRDKMKNSKLKILIHCFTGTNTFANKLIDLGCYISVSGIITFKKSVDLVKTISTIPIEQLLVETDSPYLSPEPYRGKSNEPSYIKHTVDKLAEIKSVSKEVIMNHTTSNFFKIFTFKNNEK